MAIGISFNAISIKLIPARINICYLLSSFILLYLVGSNNVYCCTNLKLSTLIWRLYWLIIIESTQQSEIRLVRDGIIPIAFCYVINDTHNTITSTKSIFEDYRTTTTNKNNSSIINCYRSLISTTIYIPKY